MTGMNIARDLAWDLACYHIPHVSSLTRDSVGDGELEHRRGHVSIQGWLVHLDGGHIGGVSLDHHTGKVLQGGDDGGVGRAVHGATAATAGQ